MNALFKLRKDSALFGAFPFKFILYAAILSDVVIEEDEKNEIRWAVCGKNETDLYDLFSSFDSEKDSESELLISLGELEEEGLIKTTEEGTIYVGQFLGRVFTPFVKESSLCEKAVEMIKDALSKHLKSLKSASAKSRGIVLKEDFEKLLDKGIANLKTSDLNTLHGILYEIYTGGEVYVIAGKVDAVQTYNMLRKYDVYTVFALITESVLNYDTYRSRYTPNLKLVANMAEDVYRALIKSKTPGSKDYMREEVEEEKEVF